ncbi:AlpA family transcriptional regulator [Hoeflea halophila]|uniref:AlpA family transcriptional regulator n=1 Tax=Hoeflea halophila TaxID=714899 RepID=A0A286IGW2_9HYPH|nr:DNA-binding protein [Hoeflea halophila]SOE18584.1 AlpA family transcriptional regulator [Hoeflea halophila]
MTNFDQTKIGETGMNSTPYLTGPQVQQRFGISEMSLWRWANDDSLQFPKPMKIRGRKFYRLDEIERWEREQMEARA